MTDNETREEENQSVAKPFDNAPNMMQAITVEEDRRAHPSYHHTRTAACQHTTEVERFFRQVKYQIRRADGNDDLRHRVAVLQRSIRGAQPANHYKAQEDTQRERDKGADVEISAGRAG